MAVVVTFALLASLAPPTPALAQAGSAVSGEPGVVSRLASWVSETLTDLFAEEPQGEMRPSGAELVLPGREGRTAAAQPTAVPPGKRVKELTAKRSATGKVFELEDGRLQAELSSRPVHYRDGDGAWKDIDTTVSAVSQDGFVQGNDSTGFSSRFGETTDKLAKIKLGERHLTLGVAGGSRKIISVVKGATVTYPGVWDGVDVVYAVTPSGVKEHLVLSKAPAAGTSFAFTVKMGGLQAEAQPDGSIAFLGEDGVRVFTIPAPFMIDATVDAASPYGRKYSRKVTQTVTQQGSEATITVTPDAAWLAAPERAWPVVVDPTIKINDWALYSSVLDTYVDKSATSTNFADSWKLQVGKSTTGLNRALLYFGPVVDADVLPIGTPIDTAKLEVYFRSGVG